MDSSSTSKRGVRWQRAQGWLIAVVSYSALATYLVMPAYRDEFQRIVGGGELGGWLWRHWWMKMEMVALGLQFPGDYVSQFLHVVSLGRFPETGNITDLYTISLPLDMLFGHPHHYNIKIALIFFTNALAAFAYVRYLTGRWGVAWIAGITLACNSFVFYEVQGSGLRQAILCFIPLYALFLDRLLHERKAWLGVPAGVFFAAIAIFYWFYGLFAAIYTVLRVLWFLGEKRDRLNRHLMKALVKPVIVFAIVAPILILPFISPYISSDHQDANARQLPEVTFLKNFPSLEALQNAPLRPNTPYENLLSSLARVLYSSWDPDWAVNQMRERYVPIAMVVFGLLLGCVRWRRTGFWLVVFGLFYSLTWGPYLQYKEEFIKIDGREILLPYWYAFKFVPMMSRLFAPYRIGSMAVVAMTVLLGLNLGAIANRLRERPMLRYLLGIGFVVAYLGQFHLDPMRIAGIGTNRKIPLGASQVDIPEWYYQLAKERGRLGIIELPLRRQQDLLNYYQVAHSKKVLGGWGSPGALPPVLRFGEPTNKVTALLQWLAQPSGLETNPFVRSMVQLGEMPYRLAPFTEEERFEVFEAGYPYVVLHELGCYLLEARWGTELYQRMKTQLEEALGPPIVDVVEHPPTSDAEEMIPFRNGMPWVPSIYSVLLIPEPRPWPLHMVVYQVKPTDYEEIKSRRKVERDAQREAQRAAAAEARPPAPGDNDTTSSEDSESEMPEDHQLEGPADSNSSRSGDSQLEGPGDSSSRGSEDLDGQKAEDVAPASE